MKKPLAFTLVFLFSTFMFWLSGFNFDHNEEGILGAWFAASMLSGLFATLFFKNAQSVNKAPDLNSFLLKLLYVFLFAQMTGWLTTATDLSFPGRSPEFAYWIVISLFMSLIISGLFWLISFATYRIRLKNN